MSLHEQASSWQGQPTMLLPQGKRGNLSLSAVKMSTLLSSVPYSVKQHSDFGVCE